MLGGTWNAPSSSSESEQTEEDIAIENAEIDVVARRGADVSLTIHDQLDLGKLQQVCLYHFLRAIEGRGTNVRVCVAGLLFTVVLTLTQDDIFLQLQVQQGAGRLDPIRMSVGWYFC